MSFVFLFYFIQAKNWIYLTRAYDPFLIVYYSLLLAGLTRQVLIADYSNFPHTHLTSRYSTRLSDTQFESQTQGHAIVYLYVMLRATHLSITVPSHASLSLHQDIIFILDIMLQSYTMYTRYRHAGTTIKIINLLGKKNTGKKTPKEDCELGYSDFTLSLTFHLTHPQQKDIQFSPMHKKNKI